MSLTGQEMMLTAAQIRAVLKALSLARRIVQDIAADERSERRARTGAACQAENAITRAERLLGVRS